MRSALTISLPEDLSAELDAEASRAGVPRSELVRDALKALLFQRRFQALRATMVAHAQERGIHTDEDVAKLIS